MSIGRQLRSRKAGKTVFRGSKSIDSLSGTAANDRILGFKGSDRLVGKNGRDRLSGHGGNDRLMGGDGDDLLKGGKGRDRLSGGAGNDLYIVTDATDQVTEKLNQGIDTVRASVNFVLGANLEHLVLLGNSNLNATGNELSNTLTGNAGNNILDGRAGADTMRGGSGDDLYFVDDINDVVIELANGGTDTVKTTVANYSRPINVEFLDYIGSGNFNGSGDNTDNNMNGGGGNDTIGGGGGNDTIGGGGGSDTIGGGSGSDTIGGGDGSDDLGGGSGDDALDGGSGDDILDGGLGIDQLIGGLGNDTYLVDHALDTVQEEINSGIDLVQASIDYVLSDQVENLELVGDALNGTGNALDNIIQGTVGNNILRGEAGNDRLIGGDGDDMLIGGAGLDTLIGGSGADTFAVGEIGEDVIEDFNAAQDAIALNPDAFGLLNLAGQALDPTLLTVVNSDDIAQQGVSGVLSGVLPTARFLYSKASGKLFYDGNGSGLLGATNGLGSNGGVIARLSDGNNGIPVLSTANIIVSSLI